MLSLISPILHLAVTGMYSEVCRVALGLSMPYINAEILVTKKEKTLEETAKD